MMVLVYPNPVVRELRITIPSSWQQSRVQFQVAKQDGQVVLRWASANASQTEVADCTRLAPGIYFVSVSRGGEMMVQKVIKK